MQKLENSNGLLLAAKCVFIIPFLMFAITILEGVRGFGSVDITYFSLLVVSAVYFALAFLGILLVYFLKNEAFFLWTCALSLSFAIVLYLDNSFSVFSGTVDYFSDGYHLTNYQKLGAGVILVAASMLALSIPIRLFLFQVCDAQLVFALVALIAVITKGTESTEFVNFDKMEQRAAVSGSPQATSVVVFLDGLIGFDGIDVSIPGGHALRNKITRFAKKHGFEVHPKAISAYLSTRASIPANLNGFDDRSVSEINERFLEAAGGTSHLLINRAFDEMLENKQPVKVFQTPYLNFCRHQAVVFCHTENLFDGASEMLRERDRLGRGAMAFLALRKRFGDSIVFKYTLSAVHRGVEKLQLIFVGKKSFFARNAAFGSLSAPKRLEQLASNIQDSAPGTLLLAHLLVPHSPYLLDETCERTESWPPSPNWLTEYKGLTGDAFTNARTQYTQLYFAQTTCLFTLLDELLQQVDQNTNHPVDVILMGDHGSRVSGGTSQKFMKHRDFIDNYSTFFATRTHVPLTVDVEKSRTTQSMLLDYLFPGLKKAKADDVAKIWVYTNDESGAVRLDMPEF